MCKKIEASVALQVLPSSKESEVFGIVDSVIEYIASTGVKYHVGPFETTMEGDLDTLMAIVTQAQKIVVAKGAKEVFSAVKIAYCPQKSGTWSIDTKISKYKNTGNKGPENEN